MPNPQQFRISNFNAGYKPNAGTTVLRNVSARDWQNYRTNQDGGLTPRAGSARTNSVALDATPETLIKAYYLRQNNADRNPMIVVDDEVKYSEDDGVTFSSFATVLSAASGQRKYEHAQYDDLLMIGNGRGEQYAIDISVSPPVAYNFYLEAAGTMSLPVESAVATSGLVDAGLHHWLFIYVREVGGLPVAYSTAGTSNSITVANADREVTLSGMAASTDAQVTHKYIYRSKATTASPFFFVGKVVNATTTFDDELADAAIPSVTTFFFGNLPNPDTQTEPDWVLSEITDERQHVVENDSDTIHLSFFDGNTEIYIRNFTDTITVGNKTEPITAVKALGERLIAIYFPRSIYLMFTDPLSENYRIVQSPVTTDDRGETSGCVAARSIVRSGSFHYFFAPNKRVYRFDGSNVLWISEDVQAELDIIEDLRVDQPVGVFYAGMYNLAYPSGSGANDRILLYDPKRNRWFRDFGLSVNAFALGRRTGKAGDDEGELWAAMGDESYVRQLYTGTQDNSVAITNVWESNKIRSRSSFTSYRNIFVGTQGAGTITATVTTEAGNASATLTPTSASDYLGQKAGIPGIVGREMQAKVSSASIVDIDEIVVNGRVTR